MRAAVLRAFGEPLSIEEVETPTPREDEALVRVVACGIDGTDLKMLAGFGYRPELPFIMGHEPAGVVERTGAQVSDLQPGNRVITYNFAFCGQCTLCRTRRENVCPHMTGVLGARGLPGGYAEYLRIPARQLVPFPEHLPFHDAAVLSDAGITAFHALDRSRLKLGETVLLIGVGGVGSFAVQFAKQAGARVIAVDQTEAKCERARSLGADFVLRSDRQDIARSVREITGGAGADCAIDIVGKESTVGAGVDALRQGGRLVILGYTPESYPLSGMRIAQNELEIIGTRCGRKQDLIDTVRVVAEGKTQSIVTDRFPFAHVNEALARLRSGQVLGRLVLEMAAS